MDNAAFELKKKIMRRVYATWILKKVFSPLAVKVYISVVLLFQLAARVHVAMVWQNAPELTNVHASISFFANAFGNTGFSLQILVLASIALGLWLARDVISLAFRPRNTHVF